MNIVKTETIIPANISITECCFKKTVDKQTTTDEMVQNIFQEILLNLSELKPA